MTMVLFLVLCSEITQSFADVLDGLGRPDIVMLDQMVASARTLQPAFAEWLSDRRNRRSIPHRFESIGYVAVSNPNDVGGRWKISGTRHTLYPFFARPICRMAQLMDSLHSRL